MKDFTAVYYKYSAGNDKSGFGSEKEAWEYIEKLSCIPGCASCEAEWEVWDTVEYRRYIIEEFGGASPESIGEEY